MMQRDGGARTGAIKAIVAIGSMLALGILTGCAGIAADAAPAAEHQRPLSSQQPDAAATARTGSEVVTTTSQLAETKPIPFNRVSVDDPSREAGTSAVTQPGVEGVETMTYLVTYRDGVEVQRELVSDKVTTPPVDEVTSIGTKPKPSAAQPKPNAAQPKSSCDPNYAGACVPIASDVDCAGGGGNGPAYVQGPVTVIGTDIYKLDADHDGIGCE